MANACLLTQHSSLAYTNTRTFRILGDICLTVSTVCDFIASAAMWCFLNPKEIISRKTRGILKSIQFLVLNRGILLVAVQGSCLVLWFVEQTYWYWLPFYFILPSLYVNLTLALLIERANIRAKENVTNASFQLTGGSRRSLEFNVANSSRPQMATFSYEVALSSANNTVETNDSHLNKLKLSTERLEEGCSGGDAYNA
ncbi:hypothetical protein SERLA73DRAFT_179486 [Serpula lacrymans var. lacrymans S7.3]|uniref:DUF6534 domain-containing protein n=2 Tax=Serpula lacrymans var. lacrymans TaxID=341189 RepID=F8PSP5_SERL3|nr:hypothetical protein SERLA73DRAFT_179486 [Serpula lacrymans var. lacrymans S7.3]